MQTIKVRTTQNVFIQYPIASIGDRIIAFILDQLILIAYTIFIITLFVNTDLSVTWIWMVVLGLPWLLYHLLFEIFMNTIFSLIASLGIVVLILMIFNPKY